jgi:hypothetical protein
MIIWHIFMPNNLSMKKIILIGTLLIFPLFIFSQSRQDPPRLKRSDSFFGLHFDFHAGPDCNEIGKNVDEAMIENIVTRVRPDFIQVDCKGHAGYSSYPTKVGNPAPGFVRDPLKIWRTVTARNGVALYMHYSGVWDARAVHLHPSWALVKADGSLSDINTSVFGSYADSLLIPQLKELSKDYGVDGVWIDGDCWAHLVDFSPKAEALFKYKTGITQIPLKQGDPDWKEYLNFNRQGFRDYVTHYTNELHRFNPDFQVASNWAFSTLMPEPVSIPVDFISGDFSPLNSMNSARLEGRFIRNQGKPWDLMTWGFSWFYNEPGTMSVKSPVQIERELATVMSLGGGVQIYLSQKRDGSVYNWTIPLLAKASGFVRARQPFCQHARPVPQIGLILSTFALNEKVSTPFGGFGMDRKPLQGVLIGGFRVETAPLQGVLNCLLASQKVVDVVAEHQLDNIQEYPLLVYPEWDTISASLKEKLLHYVSDGGRLLIVGPEAAKQFQDVLQVDFKGQPAMNDNGLEFSGWLGNSFSMCQEIQVKGSARPFGKFYRHWDLDGTSSVAATITPYGKGLIAAMYMNIGNAYLYRSTPTVRDFLDSLVQEIQPGLLTEVKGSHWVDVTLNKLGNSTILNLVNAAGPHDNDKVLVFDEIPVLGPLRISIRYPAKPKSVMLQPENRALNYTYENGMIQCTVTSLEIQEMVVVE